MMMRKTTAKLGCREWNIQMNSFYAEKLEKKLENLIFTNGNINSSQPHISQL